MKKTCCTLFCAALLFAISEGVLAADISVDSTTIFGFSKRDVNGTKEALLPATQFLGLTADKLGDGSLSLHFYGWGRTDLADNSYNSDKSAGSITYGYLQYRFNKANAVTRFGRHFFREGIVNEQIDGVSARTDLPMGFGLSAFGGATVHSINISGESNDGKGSARYGGRFNYRYQGLLEVGLSGIYETDAPALVTHTAVNYRRVGGDIWITPFKTIDIIGHSSYNPETQKFAEHSYLLNLKPVKHLVLTGEFNKYLETGSQYTWTTFSASALKPTDNSSSAGGIASYSVNKNLELAADYKKYTREFGTAARYGFDTRFKFNDNSIRGGIGYHYLNAGQGFAITPYTSASYHELHCYLMQDTRSYFASIDLLGDFFKENIYNQSRALEVTTSLGYHLTPALALSGDFSYGRNPQFTEEARALLRLTYNMTFTGSGGKK